MNTGVNSKKVYEFRYQNDNTGAISTQQIEAIAPELADDAMIDWLIEPGREHFTYLSGPSLRGPVTADQEVEQHG